MYEIFRVGHNKGKTESLRQLLNEGYRIIAATGVPGSEHECGYVEYVLYKENNEPSATEFQKIDV